ncbi:MAG: HAMP domain-containing sensor histidine kinase, partial [Bacteroidota bacterium]
GLELFRQDYQTLSDEEAAQYFNILEKSSKGASALLKSLLVWARAQKGLIPFHPQQGDITAVIDRNLELHRTLAQQKQITLRHDSVGTVQGTYDPDMIDTVVRNLICNALKFTDTHGEVRVSASQEAAGLHVTVQDTGVGMIPKIRDKVFAVDTATSTTGTHGEKGTGLGLVICREFVEKHGGRIWVDSTPGQGSTFHFTV